VAVNPPGRHRAPGRFNALTELKVIAKESAQPAVKGAAIVAASGGLIATVAPSANANESGAVVAVAANAAVAPAAVGPKVAAPVGSNALTAIGFTTAPAAPKVATKPTKARVIADVVVEQQRAAAAKAKAAAKAREAAAAARASRSTSRESLTNSTSTTKSTTNTYSGSASVGTKSSYNWATAGQCTWGAQEKFRAYTGYYLGGFYGNALDWGWKAANAGWTVTSTPRANSVLVMQPGVHGSSSAGHVAWVTSVSGGKVSIIEMNALAGEGRYNTRTLSHTSGMKYILAP
jgi:surface antigen